MVTRDRAMMDPHWQLHRASIKSIDSVTHLSPKPTAAGAGLGIRACHRKHPQECPPCCASAAESATLNTRIMVSCTTY